MCDNCTTTLSLTDTLITVTIVATLDKRLGCIGGSSNQVSSKEAEDLMRGAYLTNSSIIRTDNGLQLWRRFDTPMYKQLVEGQDTIYRYGM